MKKIVCIILGIILVIIISLEIFKINKESKEQRTKNNRITSNGNVRHDVNTDIYYVDNILIVYMTDDYKSEELDYLLDEVNGELIDSIPAIDQFQIKIKPSSYEELIAISKEIEKYDFVEDVFIDDALQISIGEELNK